MNSKQFRQQLHAQPYDADYDAAVLVVVEFDDNDQFDSILLSKRADTLRSHAGQIAFVGGKIDDDDSSLWFTATREAYEEIGLSAEHVSLLGYLPAIESKNGLMVCPVVAKLNAQPNYRLNPDEVELLFSVAASTLLAGPEYHELKRDGQTIRLPRFQVEEHSVWGLTAMILVQLLNKVAHTSWTVVEIID